MSGTGSDPERAKNWHIPGKVDHEGQTAGPVLVDQNGSRTKSQTSTLVNGDPGDSARGVGQENITERSFPGIEKTPTGWTPDDDQTQMKKIEQAAGLEPSPEGVAEPEGAHDIPGPHHSTDQQ